MNWWCPKCEDNFDEPTGEGKCPLCGYDGIQDTDGYMYGGRPEDKE